ncbi:ABC transporter ATP-binding protein [Paractinoplanes atraurantiacus]|uniref:Taurine transport system ATP-binding protein n=1 Tax=Paractinoplanes atraurantiacus TaxID=1036182 RepID=A0A285ICP9_9ACTN|nr:ABC transporter ATP-binding protein [Actinoplanes atraurantiacus]SNY45755.1 taurine transport system ATP-binding protein [Actinoplanes atraurantiacus]
MSSADPASPGDAVALSGVEHRYGDVTAVGPVDLTVPGGEFLVLVGASGCGKSTLLRLIAGFEQPTSGSVRTAGTPSPEPRSGGGGLSAPVPGRGAGLVFQQPRLFPWRSVGGNVALALRYAGLPATPDRVNQLLERVGLHDVAKRRTWQISGGQQQRVAIARALAVENPLLLLDEPFAALDALTRERLQEDLRRVSHETGRTCVFVTHSVDEAVFLGSRVIVLTPRPGRIALDLPIDLPRAGLAPDELRGLPRFAALRAEIGAAVRSRSQEVPA